MRPDSAHAIHRREDLPAGLMADPDRHRRRMVAMITGLRDRICARMERFEAEAAGAGETPCRFERSEWRRPDSSEDGGDGGGGVMSLLRGRVFEKMGVNISEVRGRFAPEFAREIPGAGGDGRFWAAGISLVAHPRSPRVPAVHMNVRHIMTESWWFGGGCDLTPAIPLAADTALFHAVFRQVCEAHAPGLHEPYRQWCDRYFFLPHRNEPRGVGGVFFDYRNSGDWEADFALAGNIAAAFLDAYPPIVARRAGEAWTEADRRRLLEKRGRYAEFNLVHDRGTRFGLMTGGNPDAVLMSLPPLAAWP